MWLLPALEGSAGECGCCSLQFGCYTCVVYSFDCWVVHSGPLLWPEPVRP